ncbi:2OG-Fe(II) oxygenase [Nonomuraea typhae]|uniref:2OG-Fe(II) oxygenase n=1 Tax=Nonomuraea typhae TaxID=2603600 RepID=UPI0012F8E99C|nr:2OG-Fe(II) oxygenase [Nonomuraea typhae]
MTTPGPRAPESLDPHFFYKIETTELAPDHLISLAAGLAGAIHVKRLLEPEQCARFVAALPAQDLSAFDEARYQVATFHFGPIINHFLPAGRLTDEYWRQAEAANAFWLSCPLGDLRRHCLSRVEAAWPYSGSARPAVVDGREVYWGMIRENSHGAPPHWDEIVREFPAGLLDVRPIVQLVFNLYLTMPARGGATTIWSRRWHPQDDAHRAGSCWPTLTPLEEALTVRPEAGDAVLFDPRHYHAVSPCSGGRRFALAFYLGITADGRLTIWS